MFNTYTYNLKPFNSGKPATSEFSDVLEYNGYAMPNDNCRIRNIDRVQSLGNIDRQTFDIANAHWQGLNNYFFKQKSIVADLVIKWDTAEEVDNAIDTLKQSLAQENKTLKFKKNNGDIVTTTAHVESLDVNREHYHITFVPVRVVFVTLEPFFYGLSTNETSFTGQSSNLSTSVSNPLGSYTAYPEINITFLTWLSSVTQVVVTLGDNTITVNENINDNDILIIDCKNQDVMINSVWGKDYTGVFPTLDIGTNTFEVTIDGTWSADIYVTWSYTYV